MTTCSANYGPFIFRELRKKLDLSAGSCRRFLFFFKATPSNCTFCHLASFDMGGYPCYYGRARGHRFTTSAIE